MHSYIIKNDGSGQMYLIYRFNGDILASRRLQPQDIPSLAINGLIETDHIILHYAKQQCDNLYRLVKGELCTTKLL